MAAGCFIAVHGVATTLRYVFRNYVRSEFSSKDEFLAYFSGIKWRGRRINGKNSRFDPSGIVPSSVDRASLLSVRIRS